jgi:crotonobetainyl-CoA:carnitine CoA-transferase CaiB-like acyl-CoA transferase
VPQPFAGYRVLDLTHVLAGPFASYQLAVLGAEVIKIEHPDHPDQVRETGSSPDWGARLMNTNYLTQSSNKRAITLNLATPQGRDVLLRLARTADVLVENYRAGALDALGLGYAALQACNPDLIYCSLTAYGRTGPKGSDTAYDGVVQATSGLMSVSGTPEITPLKVGAPIVDYASGMTAAFAIASALLQRVRDGGGQHIDVAMSDAALMLMASNVCGYLSTGQMLSRPRGNDFSTAGGSCYPTKDGLLVLAALNDRQHRRLWTYLERPDLALLFRQCDQIAHDAILRTTLAGLLLTRTAEEWECDLNAVSVPAGRVRTVPEALAMAQTTSRGSLLHRHDSVPGLDAPATVPVAAFTFAHDGPQVRTPPPALGADTEAVLREAGYTAAEIKKLQAAKII